MLTATEQRTKRQNTFFESIQLETIALTFFVLSVGALAALIYAVLTDPQVIEPDAQAGEILWNFINHFGIIRPLLIIGVSFWLARISIRLHERDVTASRWARSITFWLMLISALGFVHAFMTAAQGASLLETPLLKGIEAGLPWALFFVLVSATYTLLNNCKLLYTGEEDRLKQEARYAWNLLIPTIIVFILLAVNPLERVFISSLTNERFASSSEIEYIGLQNYGEILGIRFDLIPCEVGDNGACLTEFDRRADTDITIFPRARDYLDEQYTELRYREYSSIELGGHKLLLSARDPRFVQSVWNSTIYTVFAIAIQLTLGMIIASILASQLRGMGLLRVAMLIPLAIPTLIATQFWEVILAEGREGVANSILLGLGMIDQPQAWLVDPALQIPAVILVIVWKETPTMALLLLPGLLAIDREIYQAADVDGAGRLQRFFRITLPIMRPTIGIALILRTMVTLRVFDVFDIMLGPPTYSMATYAYDQLTLSQDLGMSSAISVTIFLIILIFTVIYVRTLRIDD